MLIEASSNPGDLVLDCFAGSGTTLEVASRHEREWIGIDTSLEAIKTTLTRLSHGRKPMGDFVSARKEKANLSPQPRALALFDFGDETADSESEDEDKPILDFAIWSEASRYAGLQSIVDDWTNGLARQDKMLKERRSAYKPAGTPQNGASRKSRIEQKSTPQKSKSKTHRRV